MMDPQIVRDMLIGLALIGVLLRVHHYERRNPPKSDIDDEWRERFLAAIDRDDLWHKMV